VGVVTIVVGACTGQQFTEPELGRPSVTLRWAAPSVSEASCDGIAYVTAGDAPCGTAPNER
jgi:hypothetical protein